jgi:sugar lactone lactonase YvrE
MSPIVHPRTSAASHFVRAALVALALICPLAVAAAAVVSGFDAGLEGWRVTGDNAMSWLSTGGNPGGCLSVNDLATGDNNLAVAPLAYLGDWRALTTADSLTVDFWFVNTTGGTLYYGPYLFRIAGPGGAATALTGTIPPQSAWTRVGVPIDAAAWTLESGTWSALLATVNSLTIECEFVTGDEAVRLDNVRLTGPVARVYEPCVVETFDGTSVGDWSFQNTGGPSNPGGSGNSGGYCLVPDGSGTSYAFAPSRFHGDWSSLAAGGYLTIDLRVVNAAGTIADAAQFIRLSGPGGVAAVPMPAASLPPAGRLWRTFTYPLDGTAWTVISGTWAGLVADVTEVRIQAEFATGDERIGLDNLGRMSATCGAIDSPVTVVARGLTACGRIGLAGIGTVARDPLADVLLGTIDAASASGGGLYAVTGAAAGTRLQGYELPTHLIVDADGNTYVTEDNSGNVHRRTAAGVSSLWVSGFHTGDDDPSGMCFAPAGYTGPNVNPGDVLVTDWGSSGADEIWAFSTAAAEGERLVMADPGNIDVHDISTGPSGSVWFADALHGGELWSLSPAGTRTVLPLSSTVDGMVSLVFDDMTQQFYVAATDSQRLCRIDPATGAVSTVARGFTGFSTCNLELDVAGRRLWVADAGAHRVYEFCLAATIGVEDDRAPVAAAALRALRAWPNPARDATRVWLSLARAADTRVNVLDLAGRLVRTLVDGRVAAGDREFDWDGRDASGSAVAPGFYVVSARAGGEVHTTSVVVLR